MSVRGIAVAMVAAMLAVAGPAQAEQVVQGTWSGGWRSADCDPGVHNWTCRYTFSSNDCVETSVAITGDTGAQLDCNVWLDDAQARIQPRINSAGHKVGCLSQSGSGQVDYFSSYPGMSQNDIWVSLDIVDGWVTVRGEGAYNNGQVTRTYRILIEFEAGCGAGTIDFGRMAAAGSVTVDVV